MKPITNQSIGSVIIQGGVRMSFVVAIDGPAGSGKGSITEIVAKKLGLECIDTGAMYRCVTLDMINKNIKLDELDKIKDLLNNIDINLDEENKKVFLNGEDVTEKIRSMEVTKLVSKGFKEVVLTGIHLSSYGVDFEEQEARKKTDLLTLILAVHEIPGIERIRLGSLEPRIITEEFAKTIAGLPKMCPHFHLSLQSGCDATLKRMNRRYTTGEYYEKCELLRKYFDHPALTTDVIVGFPGETEEEFEESKAFVDKVNFYETHIFKYSKREGTRAAVMENQVPEQIKAERSAQLIELGAKKQEAYEKEMVGKDVEILVEEPAQINGKEVQVGHTKEYIKVALESDENLQNQIVKARIDDHSQIIH